MARLLLGVSGGIAAYKALELARLAIKAGHAVRVIQTEASTRFVGTASFAGITGAPVLLTEWESDPLRGAFPGDEPPEHAPLSHLELVERADAFLIAPASANTIAKLAGGHADNLLTAAALACRRPLVVAPAMNGSMYEHPATQDNLARLRARGVTVLEPGTGSLASLGEYGTGRLPEPPELLAAFEAALSAGRELDGLNVLVTAGGTREPIDAVRFVGNRSSGRMGVALAEEARQRGAEVTLLAANLAVPAPSGVTVVETPTAADLEREARARADADVIVMAAAVADYRPAEPLAEKRPKDAASWKVELEPTSDVLTALGAARRPGQVLVGFAADGAASGLERARAKRADKHADLFVFNDVSRSDVGFDTPENEVVVLSESGERRVQKAPKREIAAAVLDEVERLLSAR
jgi:phosphopantothenoylcysteine decarboxylase / phosphopantothenate---cysteine ligase